MALDLWRFRRAIKGGRGLPLLQGAGALLTAMREAPWSALVL
ncbi:MAG: hypothetical protein WCP06_12290 [Verrucomicrobiota bacterium]